MLSLPHRSIVGTYGAEKTGKTFPSVPLLDLLSNSFGGEADRRVPGTSDRFGTCRIVSPLYVKGYKTADSKPFLFIEGSAPILL